MPKGRLEAFSDGVFAIIITIMVLELKIPHGDDLSALVPLLPVFLSYVLSFAYLGIYWNNHHHLLHSSPRVTAGIMWANLHLLFWLSLFPVITGWIGEHHDAPIPTAMYGAVCLLSAIAYTILQTTIIRSHGPDSALARVIGGDAKGRISMFCYAMGIGMAFVEPWISDGLYVLVALIWLVPDRRVERALQHAE
jgi:uncharacterized membrane protein